MQEDYFFYKYQVNDLKALVSGALRIRNKLLNVRITFMLSSVTYLELGILAINISKLKSFNTDVAIEGYFIPGTIYIYYPTTPFSVVFFRVF